MNRDFGTRRETQRMPPSFDGEGRLSTQWMMAAGYLDCATCGRLVMPEYWHATGGKCYRHATVEERAKAGATI